MRNGADCRNEKIILIIKSNEKIYNPYRIYDFS